MCERFLLHTSASLWAMNAEFDRCSLEFDPSNKKKSLSPTSSFLLHKLNKHGNLRDSETFVVLLKLVAMLGSTKIQWNRRTGLRSVHCQTIVNVNVGKLSII